MKWEKLGLVRSVDPAAPNAPTRVMVPTPIMRGIDTIRVFVTVCDQQNVGRPHYVDLDARNPVRVLGISAGPVMDVGRSGSFDERGVVAAQVLPAEDGRLLMYYSGFQKAEDVRYRIFMGLAASNDGGESFQRVQEEPILGPTATETTFRCAPFVMKTASGFAMWYVAGSSWETVRGKQVPRYSLKYLESADGIHWPATGTPCMALGEDEHGFGRPWIEVDAQGTWHLFYSIRVCSLAAYRLGYATSRDGLDWTRRDAELGLEPTPGSFDADGMSYSAIIRAHGTTYCFYNGSDFGREGFAAARLAEGSFQ